MRISANLRGIYGFSKKHNFSRSVTPSEIHFIGDSFYRASVLKFFDKADSAEWRSL